MRDSASPAFHWTSAIHLNGGPVADGASPPASAGAVVLAGDLACFRGFDVWQVMNAAGVSGCLSIVSPGLRGECLVADGEVIGAWARPNPRRLGAILTDTGAVEPSRLATAIRRQTDGDQQRLGDLLLGAGSVARPALDAALAAQSRQALAALLLVPVGRFTVERRRPTRYTMPIEVDVQALVLDTVARLDEASRGHRSPEGRPVSR